MPSTLTNDAVLDLIKYTDSKAVLRIIAKDESKVFQYLGNMWCNPAVLDAFIRVVKVTNYTGL